MRLFESERSGRLYQKVLELAGLFHSAGGRALLVGGAVRDALLGQPVKDIDLEIHGLDSRQVLEILESVCEVDAVGMSFGVIKVKHFDLDISLPRRENKTGAGHKGFLVEVDPQLSIADAAARRDFTVNAIMYDPLACELLDPHGGVADLEKKLLRHVSRHFSEDPLRVLRGMQFAARLDFSIAPETVALCAQISQEELAVERIGSEWEKLFLQGKRPSAGLEFLRQCSWLKFYPELESLSPEKWGETLALLDQCAQLRTRERSKDLVLAGAALCSFMENGGSFFRRLWNRHELISRTLAHAESFLSLTGKNQLPSLPEVRRLALKLKGVELLVLLLEGAGERETAQEISRMAQSENIYLAPPEPLLTGRHGIEAGLKAGPELGRLLKECFEAQLNGEFRDVEGGRNYLQGLLGKSLLQKK